LLHDLLILADLVKCVVATLMESEKLCDGLPVITICWAIFWT